MEFDYIIIKNFRQYKDLNLSFSRDPKKKLTIIKGVNGAGKTNLLNAITWCLYNEEYHIDNKYEGLPIVNTTILNDKINSIYEVKVEIQITHNDGNKSIISRNVNYKQDKNKKIIECPNMQSLSLMRQNGREWVGPIHGSDAQDIINKLMPPAIEEYFFFDGEKMNEYFKKNTGSDIKKAVFDISQMQLFKEMIDHLNTRRMEYFKSTKKTNPQAQQKQAMYDIQFKSQESDKAELEKMKEQKNNAEKTENTYSEYLKNSSLEQIQILEDRKQKINAEIIELKDQFIGIDNDKLKTIKQTMPTILLSDALLYTQQKINQSKAALKIPPLYEKIFIQSLLTKNVCLCGTDISMKDELSKIRRERVSSYLLGSELSAISQELIETNGLIEQMLDEVKNFPEETRQFSLRLREINKSITDKEEELIKINNEISSSNVENIKFWNDEYLKAKKEKENYVGRIALFEHNIDRRSNILRGLQSELKRELEKEKENQELLEMVEFCDVGINAGKQIQSKVMIDIKNEIEKRTSSQFLNLIWKKGTYTSVNIDDNYNISVPHISGREGLGTLSAGERQVCALSFVAALNSVSGFEIPIIIDTPLGKISDEPSRNIANNLPKYFEGKQVTILMTDKEYSQDVKDALQDYIGFSYEIIIKETDLGNIAEVVKNE